MTQTHTAGTGFALEVVGLTKSFPGVRALDNVSFTVARGEVHSLVGENGAGKSTLIKLLTGVYTPDSGDIRINGKSVSFRSPGAARAAGVSAVPQDVVVVPGMPVGRNITLGTERFWVSRSRLANRDHQAVNEALGRAGARFTPDSLADSMTVSELRLVQIAQQLLKPGSVLLLDEPTAVLSEPDSERLLDTIRDLHSHGRAVIYISHRLDEVLEISDRITVLRDGKVVASYARGEVTRSELVEVMARKRGTTQAVIDKREKSYGPELFRLQNVECRGAFLDTLTAHGGQIVGLTGIQGSGYSELVHAIAGWVPRTGTVEVDGRPISAGSVLAARAAGIALVPAQREAAVVGSSTVRQNIVLSPLSKTKDHEWFTRMGFRRPTQEKSIARRYIDELQIHPRDAEATAGSLSGGNQQKVALARLLESNARVMIVEEPTQGIDVNAKREIIALLRRAAERPDRTVIVASAEFDELLEIADVIHVMKLGRPSASYPNHEATYNRMLHDALP
ncbi:sugar ABC transporter ATP-binding protein [Arthrobacter sp. efr-133-TYG-120]|uniref:sugar ABC transporter ATP-binding protein n=1 Tax=Arthrobacter sp. efr-133-TYG-120 TaxID=3040280 RepID=UPI00254F915D|nr:sugar ABC transporter ATP-binding protein [Arthrobacter sp. efr-133-TYG-120]